MTRPHARRLAGSFVSGAAAIATVLLVGGGVAVAATRTVSIANFAFSPQTITITVGDRVTWTNSDQVAHTATATNGAFDTGNVGTGASSTVRFTKPGTYRYACTPHPTMTGTIRVRAARGGGTTLPATDTAVSRAIDGGGAASGAPAALIAPAALLIGLAISRRLLAD
jgi:plastocyanin